MSAIDAYLVKLIKNMFGGFKEENRWQAYTKQNQIMKKQ